MRFEDLLNETVGHYADRDELMLTLDGYLPYLRSAHTMGADPFEISRILTELIKEQHGTSQ